MVLSLIPPGTIAALQAAGLSRSQIDSLDGVQQLVYLLDAAGAGFGYRFKWEMYGPFSTDLAEELGGLGSEEIARLSEEPVSEALVGPVERVKALLEPQTEGLDRKQWRRLLCYVDFLQRRAHPAMLNGRMPMLLSKNFTAEQINAAKEALTALSNA